MNSNLVDVRLGGEPRFYLTPPKDIGMRIPNELLDSVGFIAHDVPSPRFGGTVCLVAVRGRLDNAYVYAVTAKHIAEAVEAGPFIIGMNSRTRGKLTIHSGDDLRWWFHPTEPKSVDAAVTPFAVSDEADLQVQFIPENVFATKEIIKKRNIGVGDEAIIVGLFTRFHGSSRHIPIVRTGNVAMMPSDKVPVKQFGDMEAYLIEGRSIGGLSGSPVFVRHMVVIGGEDQHGEPAEVCGLSGATHFLGLMHGHWELPIGFQNTEQAEAVNMASQLSFLRIRY